MKQLTRSLIVLLIIAAIVFVPYLAVHFQVFGEYEYDSLLEQWFLGVAYISIFGGACTVLIVFCISAFRYIKNGEL